MSKPIRFKFDASQPHQLRAIECTAQLLEGLPQFDSALYKKALSESGQLGMNSDVVGNIPPAYQLDEDWLLDNLNAVRQSQEAWLEPGQMIQESMALDADDGELLDGISTESHRYPVFTVEMETGTGKTYVYLRSIQELRKQFGLRKFIIVVPSVAIYEGVVKSFETMREHFKGLYSNEVTHLIQYDSAQISQLRDFATSDKVEVLLMTAASFNKSSNNLYKSTEKLQGEWKPYEYIQAVRPVLILDESQNYQTKKARQALRTLKPLLAINYSATPGERPNLFYRLGPLEAFQQGLVKKIDVIGVTEQYQYNDEQFSFNFVSGKGAGYGLAVEAELTCLVKGEPKRERLQLKRGDDLFDKTRNPKFRGLKIENVDKRQGIVVFDSGDQVNVRDFGKPQEKEDIFRTQIEETVKQHMARQKELLPLGIKVLSLFFIDRVANYVDEDGLIKRLFDEVYVKLKKDKPYWKGWKAEEVREGYFAKKKGKKGKPDEFVDTAIEEADKKKADTEAEKGAYELIMKGKERLLNLNEKVAFIFAHSALKEGWDNPNVFQICTLNQTTSESKKRQEIGRGLRLAVDQSGDRVMSEPVNILTVVANESYERFADALQKEYTEAGQLAPPKPTNARRSPAKRNDKLYKSKAFRAFWDKLMQRAEYEIHADTDAIVEACVNKLNAEQFPEPHIVVSKGRYTMLSVRIELVQVQVGLARLDITISPSGGVARAYSKEWYRKGDDLSRMLKEPILKGYKVVEIDGEEEDAVLHFGNSTEVGIGRPLIFSDREVNTKPTTTRLETQADHPVFNLIDRAAQETKLTRSTILAIFQRMSADKKPWIFRNPEGFSGVFIRTIRELLADHIAERVQYHLQKEKQESDLETLFPPEKKYAQKELVDGSRASMYDQVQVDSDVEKHFVELRLNEDGNVKGYLKFPAGFEIGMPKIIGNYNPDWGVLREDDKKPEMLMELVRETKGTTIVENLQWGHEKRKIKLAKKYFAALGIDYRTVDDTVVRWWEKG